MNLKLLSNLKDISDADLIKLRANLRSEMKRRNIPDSVGIVGEHLAIEYFRNTSGLPKLQLAPIGTKNVDALSRNGDRFSIKTVCDGSKTGTIYPDPNNQDKQLFEYILLVILHKDWTLKSIHQFSWNNFTSSRSWDKRMNAWYLSTSKRSLKSAELIVEYP